MMRHSIIWALVACLIACASANGGQSNYNQGSNYGSGPQQSYSAGGENSEAAAAAGGNGEFGNNDNAAALANGAEAVAQPGQSSYGSDQNIPYKSVNTKGNTLTSSITYPQNKGEILIHHPAAIIVKRPPTKLLVNHPPLVVKPAPVVFHKPPAVVMRKVFVKHHPRRVKVEPVFVNVVKPPAEKYFVNENKHGYGGHSNSNSELHSGPGPVVAPGANGPSLPSYASGADNAAASHGYQLLQGGNHHGLSALANIAGEGKYSHGHHYPAPSY